MRTETLQNPDTSGRLTALVNLLEWTLVLLLAYLEWGGDAAPAHVVTIATMGWIVMALVCALLWAVSLLTDSRSVS